MIEGVRKGPRSQKGHNKDHVLSWLDFFFFLSI